ncbi:MAG: hypothetical protein C5S47_04770 [Candidatus Methanogasteraceae archaeon]|nr:MAG: hypothetical protein C5S47_04770 [ANME-2 cluster archaeon]
MGCSEGEGIHFETSGTIKNPSEMHPETFVLCVIAPLRYCFPI